MRRSLATALVLAFLLALVAPARAGWACPDGTPCLHEPQGGFACARQECAGQASSCCVLKTTRCKHGVTPTVSGPGSTGSQLQAPAHCRFSVTAAPELTATAGGARLLWTGVDVAPLPTAFQLSLSPVQPAWRSEFSLGYRPPPLLTLGPSRAPPAL